MAQLITLFDQHCALFVSYAHADNQSNDPKERWLDRFLQFLKPLVRQQELTVWSDQDIKVGEKWQERIEFQLENARAVVVLVSPAFLASDYIANNELPVLLKNAADHGVAVLPIIISPCLYEETKFKYPDPKKGPHEFTLASIQSANPPAKTLVEMNEGEQNRVLLKVAKQLAESLGQSAQASVHQASATGIAVPNEAATQANTVLFDESHGQNLWWSLRPTLGSGYSRIRAITERQFKVETLAPGRTFTPGTLQGVKLLVLVIGPEGKTLLPDHEISAVQDFVSRGGGLLVMGSYTGDWHHEANLNKLLQEYGIAFNRDVVVRSPDDGFRQGGERAPDANSAIQAFPVTESKPGAAAVTRSRLLQGVSTVVTLSSCSLYVDIHSAMPILASGSESVVLEPVPVGIGIRIQEYQPRSLAPAVLAAASRTHKVLVVGSWKMFLDDFVDDTRHQTGRFYQNILRWLTTV